MPETYTTLQPTGILKIVVQNGYETHTLTADYQLPIWFRRVQEINATLPNLDFILPNPTIPNNGVDLFVINTGATAFNLDPVTSAPFSIAAGKTYYCYIDFSKEWVSVEIDPISPVIVSDLAGFGLQAIGETLNTNATALAGDGLSGTGQNPLDVNVDDSTIEIASDIVQVKPLGITGSHITNGTITSDKFVAGVATVIPYSGSSAALTTGGTITILTPDVTESDQYKRRVQVLEQFGGPTEWRIMPTSDYKSDLGFPEKVTVTKLSGGTSAVQANVLGVL